MESIIKVDTGDTAFVLISAALVMLMTPGLALFYGGMVRKKNVLSTIMHSFVLTAVIGVQWALIGYTLAFGPSQGGIVGSLDWALLSDVGTAPNGDYAKTIPHAAFMIYQGMFAAITPALGAASGAVAGLVAITPAAGFVSPSAAIAIGFVGGIVCYFGVALKTRLAYDDALDAIGIHGFGGTWGAIATGLFATKAVNPDGGDGLLAGNASLVGVQLAAVGITIAFSFVVSFALFTIIKKAVGLRPTPEDEIMGLDLTEHGEAGYN